MQKRQVQDLRQEARLSFSKHGSDVLLACAVENPAWLPPLAALVGQIMKQPARSSSSASAADIGERRISSAAEEDGTSMWREVDDELGMDDTFSMQSALVGLAAGVLTI